MRLGTGRAIRSDAFDFRFDEVFDVAIRSKDVFDRCVIESPHRLLWYEIAYTRMQGSNQDS